MIKNSLKAAFPLTIPVMAGYIFLGVAFGLLIRTAGYPLWYPTVMSLLIYSGALEYAAIPLLAQPFDPLGTFILGLMISARHLFYGIPMLEKYKNAGGLKWPLVHTLTDETFSISSSVDAPEGTDQRWFYAFISFFDFFYWVAGSTLGAVFGDLLPFELKGLDFALTALFIVLFIEQLKTREGLISGFTGLLATACILALFGSERMVILSMLVIIVVLVAGRRIISPAEKPGDTADDSGLGDKLPDACGTVEEEGPENE